MAILEVRNISKSFDGLEVLKDISFDVNRGEVLAIIGPSGSGKSTLLRCINQLEKADGGSVVVDGLTMFENNSDGRAVYSDKKTLLYYLYRIFYNCDMLCVANIFNTDNISNRWYGKFGKKSCRQNRPGCSSLSVVIGNYIGDSLSFTLQGCE